MGDTKIQWTDVTWNCVRGCSRVSSGCGDSNGGGCYAERQAYRFSGPGKPYEGLVKMTPKGPRWTGKVILDTKKLEEPLHWKKPRRIFVNSMSDLFHESLSDTQIQNVFSVMESAQQHVYQILTKRPQRMFEFVTKFDEWLKYASDYPGHLSFEKRFPHVWLGVSCEDQKTADERIPLLLQTPASVRWISAEPLLDRIDLSTGNVIGGAECRCGDFVVGDHGPYGKDGCRVCRCKGVKEPWTRESNRRLGWVVVGGESGPGARPMCVGSARSIIQQCKAAAVPVFMKQMGVWPSISSAEASGTKRKGTPGDWYLRLQDKKGGNPEEWPLDLRVREFPFVTED